ncbi:hypothetical protein ACS0TY_028812 [Phlomoides rotata]
MDLVELNSLRNALVGLPGVNGLSTEQRKCLTIVVELVANPSIIFMDEPTSGLDARAAAIVLRAVRNTVDTGRTVVCTIHQPSIDIFESFDELFLMKMGGQVIYVGALGNNSQHLLEYFESIQGVPQIKHGYNPATWMLEVSSSAVESQLDIDFAELYSNSHLHRNPQHNVIRFFMTTVIGLIFGVIFWNKGNKISKEQDMLNLVGVMYAIVLFLGGTNTTVVQSVVVIERTVFYRERAAEMFSALPYAFAQVSVETIYIAIQTLLYSLLMYSMIGFEWGATKFLWFYYYVFMCFVYFTLYGMMLVALTPSYQIAAILMSFFLSFWNLFSGFLIPRMVGDSTYMVHVPDHGDIQVKDYLKLFLGYEKDFLGYVALTHVGWALLFFFIFVYGIKVLNFQRR